MKRTVTVVFTVALAILGLAVGSAEAQEYKVRSFSLVWMPHANAGEVRISWDSSNDPEQRVRVTSVAELNAWAAFLRNHDVFASVSSTPRGRVVTYGTKSINR